MIDRNVLELELELTRLKESFKVRQVRLVELLNRVSQCESMAGINPATGGALSALPRPTSQPDLETTSHSSSVSMDMSIGSGLLAD